MSNSSGRGTSQHMAERGFDRTGSVIDLPHHFNRCTQRSIRIHKLQKPADLPNSTVLEQEAD
jgi:hypothetical protein